MAGRSSARGSAPNLTDAQAWRFAGDPAKPVILGPEARRAKGSGNPCLDRCDAMMVCEYASGFGCGIGRRDMDSCDKHRNDGGSGAFAGIDFPASNFFLSPNPFFPFTIHFFSFTSSRLSIPAVSTSLILPLSRSQREHRS